jgi:hypothetical protein
MREIELPDPVATIDHQSSTGPRIVRMMDVGELPHGTKLYARLPVDQARGRAKVTAEELVECLLAEFEYWKASPEPLSTLATGALSNVLAFATVEEFRADWHPAKVKRT